MQRQRQLSDVSGWCKWVGMEFWWRILALYTLGKRRDTFELILPVPFALTTDIPKA